MRQLEPDPNAPFVSHDQLMAHRDNQGRFFCPFTCGRELTGYSRNYYYENHYRNRCAWMGIGPSPSRQGGPPPVLDAFAPILAQARSGNESLTQSPDIEIGGGAEYMVSIYVNKIVGAFVHPLLPNSPRSNASGGQLRLVGYRWLWSPGRRAGERVFRLHGWYGFRYAKHIDEKTGGALYHPDNSTYSLFIDAFQANTNKLHCMYVVLLRSDDIHDEKVRSKSRLHVPVLFMPGPNQPSHARVYLELIAEDFVRFGPEGEGLRVIPVIKGSGGCLQKGRPFIHRILLSGIDADTPAAQFVGEFLKSCSSYICCFYCKFCGSWNSASRKMEYGGYNAPVEAEKGPGKGQQYQIHYGKGEWLITGL